MAITKRAHGLNIWMIVFTVLIVLTFIGRAIAFRMQKRGLRGDDFLITLAFASLLALQVTTWMTLDKGLGAHVWELSPENAAFQHMIQYSSGITWTIGTVSCKVAVLTMYTYIFPPSGARIAIWVAMGFSVAYAVAFIPVFMTACNPPSAAWALDPMVAAAKCHPIHRQEYASVSANMALDLAIVAIPLPVVWKLQLALRKKVMVSGLFSLGLAVVAVSAWRIWTTFEQSRTTDWSYVLLDMALQSHLEIWLGILAANLPMMSPIFTRWLAPAVSTFVRTITGTSKSGSKDENSFPRSFGRSKPGGRVRKDMWQVSGLSETTTDSIIGNEDSSVNMVQMDEKGGNAVQVEVRAESVSSPV